MAKSYRVEGPLGVGNAVAQAAFVLPDGTEIPGPAVDTNGGTTISGLGRLFGMDMLGALDLSERVGSGDHHHRTEPDRAVG